MNQSTKLPPISDGQIEISAAVHFLAAVVYADEEPTLARKRVRQRIRDGIKAGALRVPNKRKSNALDAADFFDWAKTKKGWSLICEIDGLPSNPISGQAALVSKEATVKGAGVVIPSDYEELRTLYRTAESKLQRVQQELADCRVALAACTEELELRRLQENETRRKKSEAGRRGKNVPRRRS